MIRWWMLWSSLLLVACAATEPTPLPTAAQPLAPAATLSPPVVDNPLPPTWTPVAAALVGVNALPTLPTRTPRPTPTPWPTRPDPSPTSPPTPGITGVPVTPTASPTSTDTPSPTATPPPVVGANLLPNPGFESGWYNHQGVAELQVPHEWRLEWEEGNNSLDPDPWNRWVRPETRVLSDVFLPPAERPIFIWDGRHTVKVFKQYGAISFRLVTEVPLDAGRYVLDISVFPDLIVGYTPAGEKIWAPDPLSGEIQLVAGPSASGWERPRFGRRNRYSLTFDVESAASLTLGVAVRGRWAILNNGWFLDAWSLRQASP